jgi:tetratricopeptide (TPR) repeat protein
MIYSNAHVRRLDLENIRTIFTYTKASTYQPIRVLSYAIDYHFWDLNPLGYHMTNIFFYILTCLMVYFCLALLSSHLRKDGERDSHFRVAFFGAMIFAAHPVHVEAVTWLAARKEVLQGFFFFLGFTLYLKGREEEGRKRIVLYGLVLLSVLLAMLSKPSAIVFPAILLLYEVARMKGQWKNFVKKHWFFFLFSIGLSLIFAAILLKVMVEAGGVKPYHGGSFLNNLLISFYVFLYHVKLLILTIDYSAAYTLSVPYPVIGIQTFVIVGMVLLLFGWSFWSLKKARVLFFSFFFFVLTLLPYLNLIPISTLLADRYVFISSFSYCFLLGLGFDKIYSLRLNHFSKGFFPFIVGVVFLFMLAWYSFLTIRQNTVWENSYTLWADAVEKYPESNTANALLGVVYMEVGMDEKAAGYLEKAIQILPYDYQSRNNLGIVYDRLGQYEKALEEYRIGIKLQPENQALQINLSLFYMRQKDFKKAVQILTPLISVHPQDANLHFRMGMLYREMGEYRPALSEFEKSMALAPHIINPYEAIGNLYLHQLKDVQKAKDYYLKGIEKVPEAKSRVNDLRWTLQDLECY